MSSSDTHRPVAASPDEIAVRALYRATLDGWNARDGEACAAPFAEDCEIIGVDGSEHVGRAGYAADLRRIFADHVTPAYVASVRRVRQLNAGVVMLHAVAGMVPAGETDINPQLNAVQTVTAVLRDGEWRILHFQTTPALYHGRPEVADQLTDELRKLL